MTGGSDPLLVANGLTKRYGDDTVVDAVDMSVRPGQIVGLLGANGAGKTTLLRMLLGLLLPTDGDAVLLAGPPTRPARARVGYVPQSLGLYRDLTVGQNWRFHTSAYGVKPPDGGLDGPAARRLVADLSLGEQRRLAFAIAGSHHPALLVLDEPTSGVGPLGRARLWDDIHAAADRGIGVLVTTHYLSEAEQCDALVVMAAGRVVARGTVAEVVQGSHAVLVGVDEPGPVLTALTRAGMAPTLAEGGVAVPGDDVNAVRGALDGEGLSSLAVDVRPATLEERFVELASQ